MKVLNTSNKPIKLLTYFSNYRKMNEERLNKAIERVEELKDKLKQLRRIVGENKYLYKKKFGIDLDCYDEWNKGVYITGRLFKIAKGLFTTKGNRLQDATDILNLLKYAKYQQELVELDKTIELSSKAVKIKRDEYIDYIIKYTMEIHKVLFLEGAGYKISNGIGTISIIRYKNKGKSDKIIDYNETNKARRKALENGEQLYDKATAKWCKDHGIEYNVKRITIYKDKAEYLNSFAFLNSVCSNGKGVRFIELDFRCNKNTIGLTNDEIIEKYNNNAEDLCNAPVGLKTKLSLMFKVKPELFNNYIRYENQQNITDWETDRKD